jgi:hypothetical protein
MRKKVIVLRQAGRWDDMRWRGFDQQAHNRSLGAFGKILVLGVSGPNLNLCGQFVAGHSVVRT